MERIKQIVRPDWQTRLDAIGFHFHSLDEFDKPTRLPDGAFIYWREDVAYRFSEREVESIYAAARELYLRCLDAVDYVIRENLFSRLAIPPEMVPMITASWERDDPTLFGRFDLTIGPDGVPKMYEYNADTPTSIIEASLAQWFWKEDVQPGAGQFNSLHENLVSRWAAIKAHYREGTLLHFACMFDSQEDIGNVEYLMDTAVQAGWSVKLVDVKDIGTDGNGYFYDRENRRIALMFKLFPWEWMSASIYGGELAKDCGRWVEPPWKAVLSNKGILPILWQMFPGHPHLLEASFDAAAFRGRHFARKPFFSREGSNVELVTPEGRVVHPGPYGAEGFIYQAYAPAPRFDDHSITLGAWMVDDVPSGLCVREQVGLVAKNTSFFVPHYFDTDSTR
ncbi:glutathionylspermidine synthase family protein [Robbsia sp. KACC 23696]|uniref:glutathionylspermidine synthase family protein n=1 Tax=Robbsia sp. KACC 23696 TaxID=3149231 RepID=UPI00325B58DB